ncbi:MAG TPA: isoaspartyl peptidase/L-asparaginase [Trueperaceae bacterium]
MPDTTLIIHGGAGTVREEDRPAYLAGLKRARDVGYDLLSRGAGAVEAVIAAVMSMEDDPLAFNAGTGGSPTRDGRVECDAAIMASDGSSGAVAALTRARNPIAVADKVRTSTPHALFAGAGADALVDQPIDNELLLTPRTLAQLERWRRAEEGLPSGSATVGAVALDATGAIAAATSTGGTLGKWPGRVGDTPLIGAGTYAGPAVGVSCTGKGEAFIRAVTAKGLACRLEAGATMAEALRAALAEIAAQHAHGGLIAVSATGLMGVAFNSPHMAYALRSPAESDANVSLEAEVRIVGTRSGA